MVGRLAMPDGNGRAPAVLIAHGAPGLDDYVRSRPEMFARLGYVSLAIDYHGGGRVLTGPGEQAERMEVIGSNPELLRTLGAAGLAALVGHERVDPTRVAAVGYCFGAVVAMELARSGADLRAVIGLHPGLTSPRPSDSQRITARVLMCVGADDPIVGPKERLAFESEMREAGVRWEMILYGGVKHRFTDPNAAAAGNPALAYNEVAARRSWRAVVDFLDETLNAPTP